MCQPGTKFPNWGKGLPNVYTFPSHIPSIKKMVPYIFEPQTWIHNTMNTSLPTIVGSLSFTSLHTLPLSICYQHLLHPYTNKATLSSRCPYVTNSCDIHEHSNVHHNVANHPVNAVVTSRACSVGWWREAPTWYTVVDSLGRYIGLNPLASIYLSCPHKIWHS